MKASERRKLIREEVRNLLREEDIKPIGPDGEEITDPKVIRNLNMAVKSIASNIRPKIIDLITDPEAAKSLNNKERRAAVIAAIAIAFGISFKEFGETIPKIKNILKSSEEGGEEAPE